ncbi:MAG: hypothetical protein IT178_11650 [Acidobacteria bacterium]|nr:hypothetical protein [Acidobacteriota bacterium]
MSTLVAYISGHGFGHAVRTLALLNAVADLRPDLPIVIRAGIPAWLVEKTARPSIRLEPLDADTGAVQHGSLHVDVGETVRRAVQFMTGRRGAAGTPDWPRRVDDEVRALERLRAGCVVADLPPLGIAAGHAAGLPTVAFGNFTWDWIYRAYPGGAALADTIGRIYADADLALRLPMWGGFETMTDVEDVPLVARVSARSRDEVRRAFGWPLDTPLVLPSFGGFGIRTPDLDRLARLDGYHVLVPDLSTPGGASLLAPTGSLLPLDETRMYAMGFRYEDVVHAVDVVVSKPGYGIISECAANGTALLYTSRGDFAEYPVLVQAMPDLLRARFIDQETLFTGNWQASLDAVLAEPAPPPPRLDGATVAAHRLLRIRG